MSPSANRVHREIETEKKKYDVRTDNPKSENPGDEDIKNGEKK